MLTFQKCKWISICFWTPKHFVKCILQDISLISLPILYKGDIPKIYIFYHTFIPLFLQLRHNCRVRPHMNATLLKSKHIRKTESLTDVNFSSDLDCGLQASPYDPPARAMALLWIQEVPAGSYIPNTRWDNNFLFSEQPVGPRPKISADIFILHPVTPTKYGLESKNQKKVEKESFH